MIPVRSARGSSAPEYASLTTAELEILERGLRVVAPGVPLGADVCVDAVAHDPDGSPVLVLVEDGSAEPLFLRAAQACAAYRELGPLLQRLDPTGALDAHAVPSLILVARRFPDVVTGLLRLLRVPRIRCLEAAPVDGPGGPKLVVTARTELRSGPPAVHRITAHDRVVDRAPTPYETRAEPAAPANGTRLGPAGTAVDPPPVARRAGLARGELGAADGGGAPSRGTADRGPDGGGSGGRPSAAESSSIEVSSSIEAQGAADGARSYLDEVKQRVLRMSPDVFEEGDGDSLRFHVGAHRLCTLTPRAGGVSVVPGGRVAGVHVRDDDSLEQAIDAVFDRFFQLVDTRRRVRAIDEESADGAAAELTPLDPDDSETPDEPARPRPVEDDG